MNTNTGEVNAVVAASPDEARSLVALLVAQGAGSVTCSGDTVYVPVSSND